MNLNAIVIDDSPVQLLIASRLIQRNKHLNLLGAYTNPYLGLSAINSMEVDVVILDIEMPEIDGLSLIKFFDEQVKVIMNSTKPSFEFQAYTSGASDFLCKPLSASSLDFSISKILAGDKYSLISEKVFTAIAS